MSENANAPLQAWEAYGDLIELVKDHMKWKRIQLVDALNADAFSKIMPQCKYSLRGIESLKAPPKKGKSPRKPRLPRLKHLHEWFSEQIAKINKTSEYALRLEAIAPLQTNSPASDQVTSDQLTKSHPNKTGANPKRQFFHIAEVMTALQELIDEKMTGCLPYHNTQHSLEGALTSDARSGARLVSNRAISSEAGNSKDQTSVASQERSYKQLLQHAEIELKGGRIMRAAKLFDRLASKEHSRAFSIWVQYMDATYNAHEALWRFAQVLVSKQRFDEAVSLLERDARRHLRRGDAYHAAWGQVHLGWIHNDLAQRRVGQSAESHRSQAISAFQAASKLIIPDSAPRCRYAWAVAQHYLGAALRDKASLQRNKDEVFKLLKEASEAHRGACRWFNWKNNHNLHATFHLHLAVVLFEIHVRTDQSGSSQQTSSLLQEATAACKVSLKALPSRKMSELRMYVQVYLGRTLFIKVLAKGDPAKCGKSDIRILMEAKKLFEGSLSFAKKKKWKAKCEYLELLHLNILKTCQLIRQYGCNPLGEASPPAGGRGVGARPSPRTKKKIPAKTGIFQKRRDAVIARS